MSTTVNQLDLVKFDDSNPEARCPCLLLLDTSGSMSGNAINELNAGLETFQQEIQRDDLAAMRVEVAVVAFGNGVHTAQGFVSAHQFSAPRLTAGGNTPMGAGIHYALDQLRQRKDTYKQNGVPYYRPWVFMITDGAPTDEWRSAGQRVQQEENDKAVAFFAVGVEKADMKVLTQICKRQPLRLKGLNFRDMFVWLSQSLTTVSHSQVGQQVPLSSPAGWSVID
ncbi:MAG: VWA domain-containing protein [Caldilineaceae bacterium]|nr:VWA domain-containing protein [Caldilineaceae bacterium]